MFEERRIVDPHGQIHGDQTRPTTNPAHESTRAFAASVFDVEGGQY